MNLQTYTLASIVALLVCLLHAVDSKAQGCAGIRWRHRCQPLKTKRESKTAEHMPDIIHVVEDGIGGDIVDDNRGGNSALRKAMKEMIMHYEVIIHKLKDDDKDVENEEYMTQQDERDAEKRFLSQLLDKLTNKIATLWKK